jgi:hypothetical protein
MPPCLDELDLFKEFHELFAFGAEPGNGTSGFSRKWKRERVVY